MIEILCNCGHAISNHSVVDFWFCGEYCWECEECDGFSYDKFTFTEE